MSSLGVVLRFSFQGRADIDHKVCVRWVCCDPSLERADFTDTLELSRSDGAAFSEDLSITRDRPQRIFFKFEYEGCDPERVGSYLLTKSVQDPVLITEVDRRGEDGVVFRFKINYHTYFGQILAIVGSLPELGYWDVTKALKLEHSGSFRRSQSDKGLFTDNKYNWQGDVRLPRLPQAISYKYFVMNECADPLMEPGNVRMLSFANERMPDTLFEFNDVWRWNEITQTVFAKRLFDATLCSRENMGLPTIGYDGPSEQTEDDLVRCIFCAHCGLVGKARSLAVVGSIPELGQWNPSKGVTMEPAADLQWSTNVLIPRKKFPFEFKVVAIGGADSIVWETHENRWATLSDSSTNEVVTLDCWHLSFPNLSFHGSGIVVDVSTVDNFDFGKLGEIADWCKKVRFAAIHLVGLFDTTAMCEETDGLPVSGYALNPIFAEVGPDVYKSESKPGLRSEILARKLKLMEQSWERDKETLLTNEHFLEFKRECTWLRDYERICYGRKIGKDYPEEVDKDYADFVDYVQWQCRAQLAHGATCVLRHNVALGADIPFALSEKSAEAFSMPQIFMRDYWLGIQPSADNPTGTVLKAYPYAFPAAEEWFKTRISYFAQIFTIIRFESTIEYFRQWIVPRATCVRAVFGHYEPSVNVSYAELETWGLWDVERYIHPYITSGILQKLFSEDARRVETTFMELRPDRTLAFKPEFSTEKGLVSAELPPEQAQLRDKYKEELLRLLGEVILIKVGDNEYRPRPMFTLAATSKPSEKSFSFSDLPSYNQSPFIRLEEEFMNNKQRTLWSFNGHNILQAITVTSERATFFSDAAGISGEMCDEALQSVGIMPLRVQLEGRTRNAKFDDILGYPYFSVACPLRAHSLQVPMRVLWERGDGTQNLWEEEFWETGSAPAEYTDDVAVNVMKQHCWSGSMWVMFPIDCLVGARKYISGTTDREYGVLNLHEYFNDEHVASTIKEVLQETKRL